MTVTFKLVETNTSNEIDLVYDAVTQAQYQTYVSGRTLDGPVSARFHTPDDAPPELIQLVPGLRTMFFRLNIAGDDADDTLNKNTDLARWVDGEDQQAARYWTDGDVNRIELHVAIDDATNTTKIPIVYGNLSAIDAMLNVFGEDNAIAFGAGVQLFMAPYGEGDSFALRNDLLGSPGFAEFSGGSALGWGLIGTPTLSQATNTFLSGGASARIATDSSTSEGIISNHVTASTGSDAVAYAWVGVYGDADELSIELLDGSNNVIDTASFDPSSPTGYDFKVTTLSVDTTITTDFYRYSVSGQNTSAANFRLRIRRASGDATQNSIYFIDNTYLQIDTTSLPTGMAWCSSKVVANRYDPSSSNPNRLNYVDIWGIPGDANALVKTSLFQNSTGGADYTYYVGQSFDGADLMGDIKHYIDSNDFSTITPVSIGTWSTGTGTIDNHYFRCTSSTGTIEATSFFDTDSALAMARRKVRVFGVLRSSHTTSEARVRAFYDLLGTNINTYWESEWKGIATANTWNLVDFGVMELPDANEMGELDLFFDVQDNTTSFDLDGIFFVPTQNGFIVSPGGSGVGSSVSNITFDGETKTAYGFVHQNSLGKLWTVRPGKTMSRDVILISNTSNLFDISITDFDVSFKIIPRTRHLLGTV